MQIKGHKLIEASPAECYRALTDSATLVKTMPGLKAMTETEEGKYQAQLEMGVAAIKGRYQGVMAIEDAVPNMSYRLVMEGQGPGGFVSVNMQVRFDEYDPGCDVIYEGEAKVGGTVAGVGQRMLSGVATFIVNQFFNNVSREVKNLAISSQSETVE